ncbi:hypothetical protein EMMF5_002915 [Cystobasidiomycetes sp. EMM_F5]
MLGAYIVHWFGRAQRRKTRTAHEELLREKDAFKEKEILTHQAASRRFSDEAEQWRKQAELNRAASDNYKRLLDTHGIKYERATMLFSPGSEATAVDGVDNLRSLSQNSMLKNM